MRSDLADQLKGLNRKAVLLSVANLVFWSAVILLLALSERWAQAK